MLTGDAIGGVWTYCLDLAAGLAPHGEATIAVLGPPPSAEQVQLARAAGVAVVSTGLPLDWNLPDAGALRSLGAALAGLAQRLRVDLVHLHTPSLAAEVPWSVPVCVVAHSDVGSWFAAVHGGPLPADLAWQAQATALGLAEADAVMAPSRAFARTLGQLYRPGRPIEVVHNGRAPLALPAVPRMPEVLAAGRLWDAGKNVAVLDRAAAMLDTRVVAAGALEGPEGGEAVFTTLVTPGVLGPASMAEALARASVFVSCARYEPFGLAVLEAAQAGLALALSDIPTHRELWDGAAIFFHPDDAAGCADVLRRLLASPQGAGRRARERAAAYTTTVMVERTRAVHARLACARDAA